MTHSSSWSNGSAPCRLEWRTSIAFVWTLRCLGALAVLSVLASEVPTGPALALAAGAAGWTVRASARLMQQPALDIVVPHQSGRAVMVDGLPAAAVDLVWRGPLAVLHWRDAAGRPHRRVGLPDNLDPCMRRELRLAWRARQPARPTASMAP